MIDPSIVPALQDALMVARVGSVAVASRRLHKTPSAVSQQLRRVEEHFGLALFERAGRGVRLSSVGESAISAIARFFDEAESLFGLLAELSGEQRYWVRVAASDYLGNALLAPVIRELIEERAPLRFEITTTHSLEAQRWVERGEVDFAILTLEHAHESLERKPLFDQPFVWIGPRVSGKKRPFSQRLREEPVLRLAAGSQGRSLLDEYLERNRIRPVSTIDVPNVSLVLSYALGGLGVGLLPALALDPHPHGALQVEQADVPSLPVQLAYRANFPMSPPVALFAQRLLTQGSRAALQLRPASTTKTRPHKRKTGPLS